MKIDTKVITVSVSAFLFVISLTQVGFYAGEVGSLGGGQILVSGWLDSFFSSE